MLVDPFVRPAISWGGNGGIGGVRWVRLVSHETVTCVFWTPRSGLCSTFCSIAPPCTMKLFSISLASSLAEVKRDVQQKPRFLSFQKMAKKRFTPNKENIGNSWHLRTKFFACATYMSVAYAISGKFSHLRIDEPRGPSKQDQEIKIDVKKVMTCFLPCFSSGFCHTSCFSWHG